MIKLEPNHIKLYNLHRNLEQFISNVEINDYVPYVLAIIGILTIFNLWQMRRSRIINFWINFRVPMQNIHVRELTSPNENYIACFRSIQYPALLMLSFNMPHDLSLLKLYMDNLYINIRTTDGAVDLSYEMLGAFISTNPDYRVTEEFVLAVEELTARHDHIISIWDRNIQKICIFRKLESLYMRYDPTYTRIAPWLEDEGATIENNPI